jgi:hypothetical protein
LQSFSALGEQFECAATPQTEQLRVEPPRDDRQTQHVDGWPPRKWSSDHEWQELGHRDLLHAARFSLAALVQYSAASRCSLRRA